MSWYDGTEVIEGPAFCMQIRAKTHFPRNANENSSHGETDDVGARSSVIDMPASARGAPVSRVRFVFGVFASGKVGACMASSVVRLCVRVLGAGAGSPRAGSSVGLGRRGPGAAARDLWGSGDGRRQAAAREREERVAHHNNRGERSLLGGKVASKFFKL